jgi:hypothetical protein
MFGLHSPSSAESGGDVMLLYASKARESRAIALAKAIGRRALGAAMFPWKTRDS